MVAPNPLDPTSFNVKIEKAQRHSHDIRIEVDGVSYLVAYTERNNRPGIGHTVRVLSRQFDEYRKHAELFDWHDTRHGLSYPEIEHRAYALGGLLLAAQARVALRKLGAA